MKIIFNISLLILALLTAQTSYALVANTTLTQKSAPAKHKLKFKEKAALWILKRKIKKIHKKLKNQRFKPPIDSTDCTTIYLRTGDSLQVKLLRTSETSVTYRRCDPNDNLIVSLSKNDISRIVLFDGIVAFRNTTPLNDYRKKPSRTPSKKIDRTNQHNRELGLISILTGLLNTFIISFSPGFAIFVALIALLFGILAIKKNKGKGRNLGIVGIMIATLSLILVLIF